MYVTEVTRYIAIAVMMAKRIHLYPFRTQKLSSLTPKVLRVNPWEDRKLPLFKKSRVHYALGFIFFLLTVKILRS